MPPQPKRPNERVATVHIKRRQKTLLTEAGQISLYYADTAFKAGDELLSTLSGRPIAERHVLRVGALTTLSPNFQLQFLSPLVGRPEWN